VFVYIISAYFSVALPRKCDPINVVCGSLKVVALILQRPCSVGHFMHKDIRIYGVVEIGLNNKKGWTDF